MTRYQLTELRPNGYGRRLWTERLSTASDVIYGLGGRWRVERQYRDCDSVTVDVSRCGSRSTRSDEPPDRVRCRGADRPAVEPDVSTETLPATADTNLRCAAQAVLNAQAAYRDALNGIGHEGEPHDRSIHMDPCTSDRGVHVYSPSNDCAACGGAEYGTEDSLTHAYGDLRVALGGERLPWE